MTAFSAVVGSLADAGFELSLEQPAPAAITPRATTDLIDDASVRMIASVAPTPAGRGGYGRTCYFWVATRGSSRRAWDGHGARPSLGSGSQSDPTWRLLASAPA